MPFVSRSIFGNFFFPLLCQNAVCFCFLQRHLVSPSNWGRGRYGSYYSFADSMTARAPREMEGSFAETDEVEKETN